MSQPDRQNAEDAYQDISRNQEIGEVLCSSEFLFNFAALFRQVQRMYRIHKIGFLLVAVIIAGAVAFVPQHGGGQTDRIADSYGITLCMPAFDVATPAVDGYMELASCNAGTVLYCGSCRTVFSGYQMQNQTLQDISSSGFLLADGQLQSAAPERMSDYFVYALERIII